MTKTYTYWDNGNVRTLVQTDDAGVNDWAEDSREYAEDGTLLSRTLTYDDGGRMVYERDLVSGKIDYTESLYDPDGNPTHFREVLKGGYSSLELFDVANKESWASHYSRYEPGGALDLEIYTFKNGDRKVIELSLQDRTGDDDYSGQLRTYQNDASGRFFGTSHTVNLTDGIYSTTDRSPPDGADWYRTTSSFQDGYKYQEIQYLPDLARKYIFYDATNSETWLSFATVRNAANEISQREYFYDNGDYTMVSYDLENVEDWQWEIRNYNVAGQLTSFRRLSDNGEEEFETIEVDTGEGLHRLYDEEGRLYRTIEYSYTNGELSAVLRVDYDVTNEFDWDTKEIAYQGNGYDYGEQYFFKGVQQSGFVTTIYDDGSKSYQATDFWRQFTIANYFEDPQGNLVRLETGETAAYFEVVDYAGNPDSSQVFSFGQLVTIHHILGDEYQRTTTEFDAFFSNDTRSVYRDSSEFFGLNSEIIVYDDNRRTETNGTGLQVSFDAYGRIEFKSQVSDYPVYQMTSGFDVRNEASWASFEHIIGMMEGSEQQVDKLTTVYDSGAVRVLEHDVENTDPEGIASWLTWYEDDGSIGSLAKTFDDGHSESTTYDQRFDARPWSTVYRKNDADGRLDFQRTTYDNGHSAVLDYDQAEDNDTYLTIRSFDNDERLLSILTTYDDGSQTDTFYDYEESENWEQYSLRYDDQGRLEEVRSLYNNGSVRLVEYDADDTDPDGVHYKVSWYDESDTLVYVKTVYDDGTTTIDDMPGEPPRSEPEEALPTHVADVSGDWLLAV